MGLLSAGTEASGFASLIPQAMTQSIMAGGGLGEAFTTQLADSIDPSLRTAKSSIVADPQPADALFAGDVLAHLDAQLGAAQRLLSIVLEQGAAIRRRDVQNVVRLAGAAPGRDAAPSVTGERQDLDCSSLAGTKLSMPAELVTLTMLEGLLDVGAAGETRLRSSELRGLLAEIQREHTVNRALMTQELAFLDHLLRLAGGIGGYDAAGDHTPASRSGSRHRRVFDLEA